MKILALDQASRTSGYAIFEDGNLIENGIFTLIDDYVGDRLVQLRDTVLNLIQEHNIELVLFEDIQYQSGAAGVTTYKVLAEVFGVLEETLTEKHIQYKTVHSQTWKSVLNIKGRARAEQKRNAQLYVLNTFNLKVSSDAADAICIGSAYYKENKSAF